MAVNQTEVHRVEVDNSLLDGTGLPVKGSVAVPGGATAANQATEISSLASILTALADLLTELGQKLEPGGTVQANAGTNLNTSLLALEAGNLATLVSRLDVALSTRLKPSDTLTAVGAINSLPTAGGKTLTFVPVAQGAPGTTVLAAADATKKHKVLGCVLTLAAAGTIKFTDTGGDLTGAMDIVASGGFVLTAGLFPYFETGAINRAISIVTTGGAAKGVVAILTEA